MYKLASAAILAAAAGSVMAQGQSPAPSFSLPFGLSFSPQCQAAVVGVITNSDFAKCFPITDILPAISGNDSLVPYLDKFMTDLCYNYPVCSDDTLKAAAQAVLAGCSADLQKDGFSDQVVVDAFSAYPIVREVLCLKTTDPYTAQSYGGFLGPPAIPIVGNPIYNSTNGTFCVTSVATQLSAYFGTNITVPFLGSIISGQNATALQLATSINPNIVCNTCFFAALEVVDLVVPAVGQTPVAAVLKIFGATVPSLGQTTIDQLFDWTCAYKPLALSTNGQLPNGISVSIVDSTYPATLMDGTMSGGANGCKRALFGRKI